MEDMVTIDDAFDVGTWVGRRQAFALMAGRCSAADAEILFEIREKKLFRKIEPTWEDFCAKRLGLSRGYVDRIIRQARELGPNYARLNSFVRIKAAEYRRISPAMTDDGLSYDGEVIALEPENAPKLAVAVDALRRDSTTQILDDDPTAEALAKAGRAMQAAIAEVQRLRTMELDSEARSRLMSTIESWRDQLDRVRTAA